MQQATIQIGVSRVKDWVQRFHPHAIRLNGKRVGTLEATDCNAYTDLNSEQVSWCLTLGKSAETAPIIAEWTWRDRPTAADLAKAVCDWVEKTHRKQTDRKAVNQSIANASCRGGLFNRSGKRVHPTLELIRLQNNQRWF